MPKTAFVLSNPRIKCIEKDKLEFFLNYLTVELMEECPQLDFPPVILSVVSIPNSNMVNVTYAFRYEVEK